jgi:hypothetical protein
LLLGLIATNDDPVVTVTLREVGVEPPAIRGRVDELRPASNSVGRQRNQVAPLSDAS